MRNMRKIGLESLLCFPPSVGASGNNILGEAFLQIINPNKSTSKVGKMSYEQPGISFQFPGTIFPGNFKRKETRTPLH